MDIIQNAQDRDLVIIGLAVATSPERAALDIPTHWQRFFVEQVSARLPLRQDDTHLYCVYCDYQSDHRGAYTMLLGHAVSSGAVVPQGMRRVRIPAGRYAQLSFDGRPEQVINAAWSFVNERWDGRANRRYIADYERYRPDAMTPDQVSGQISIGVD
jgi:predicted transcriptional regulator YdeE